MRHAKTEILSHSGRDYDRKLAPKGIEQCQKLKDILNSMDFADCDVHCSSAQRTTETSARVLEKEKQLTYHDELYLTDKEYLLRFLRERQSTRDILLIGHNFGLSDLASCLLDQEVYMKTGSMLSIEFACPDSSVIEEGKGELLFSHRTNAKRS